MTRCPAALFLARHDVMLRQKRDADGAAVTPHVLLWECQRCGRVVGETAAPVGPPRPLLLPRRVLERGPRPVVLRPRIHALTEKRRP